MYLENLLFCAPHPHIEQIEMIILVEISPHISPSLQRNCKMFCWHGAIYFVLGRLVDQPAPSAQFPEHHSFPRKAISSIVAMLSAQNMTEEFHKPLSYQGFNEFNALLEQIITQLPQTTTRDSWPYIWNSQQCSSMKIYKHLLGKPDSHITFKLIRTCASIMRHKIFLWLTLHDIINTRRLFKCKGVHTESYDCMLCNEAAAEPAMHLLQDYTFAQSCWEAIVPNRDTQASLFLIKFGS